MAIKRKQHRRAVSVSSASYDRLKVWCAANGRSMSGVVEDLVKTKIDHEARATVTSSPTS